MYLRYMKTQLMEKIRAVKAANVFLDCALALALCASFTAAPAQTRQTAVDGAATQRMSLDECLAFAADHNLALKTADRQVERARTLQGTAWDVERTELSLSQDPTAGGSPDNAVALSQQIEFPTVYAARHGQLKAEARAERSRRNVTAQQLRADIVAAYWQLVYGRERMAILAAQDSVLRHYADVESKRYAAGDSRQLEAITARRMVHENALELATARADCAAAQQQLATLLGTALLVEPADGALRPLDYTPDGFVFGSTPEGELAAGRVAVADKALRVAKNGWAPSLSLTLKNQLVITGWDPYHENRARYSGGNFMGFEVGIGVPLVFGATKAKVKAARADREIAELELQRQHAAQQADYNAALARYTTAFSRLRYYDGQGADSAREMERLATEEYEQGELTSLEYVHVLQESIDSRLKRAEAVNAYNLAVVELKRLAGKW